MDQNQVKILIDDLVSQLRQGDRTIACSGLAGPEIGFLLSRLVQHLKRTLLVVVPSDGKPEQLAENTTFFLPPHTPAPELFPAYHIPPYSPLGYHNQTAARRISILYRLMSGSGPSMVITTAEALLYRVIPKKAIVDYGELVLTGEDIDRDALIEKLIIGGYSRSAVVEEPGDFAVRGGIIDVFTPTYTEPVRIEFFGDRVDGLRCFNPSTQRKSRTIDEVVILPAREVVVDSLNRDVCMAGVRERAADLELPVTRIRQLVDQIKALSPGFIERLGPLVYPEMGLLTDFLPGSSLVVQVEPHQIAQDAELFRTQVEDTYRQTLEQAAFCLSPEQHYAPWVQLSQKLNETECLQVSSLPVRSSADLSETPPARFDFQVHTNDGIATALKADGDAGQRMAPLVEWIGRQQRRQTAVVVVCRRKRHLEHFGQLMQPYGTAMAFTEDPADSSLKPDVLHLTLGQLSAGFQWPALQIAYLTYDELLGSRPRRKTRPKPGPRTEMLALEDLAEGDLVVHEEHGIGRYTELTKLKIDGATNDFLLLLYKDGDKLYLPVDRMNTIQKYMGIDDAQPVLDKLGGASWAKVKARVKKSAQKIAGELLKLYAARKVETGTAFEIMDEYLHRFEAEFPYEETDDQLKAITEVLDDMRRPAPMDRLICGDVGYGKTEVALRAAFAAAFNGKQVAVLVPTTVLAEQHLETFAKRFHGYPVKIACLSRFRPISDQRRIIAELADGSLDIVIGTHRLLSADVHFNSLGLIILDEEQRFGVRHKEKLKQLRKNADVLTLTATPIPRTLHLSLTGIRDISVIATPPEHRRPIITYISVYDDTIAAEAIRKELKRGGQMFFIHNSIESIDRMANRLQTLVPEVRLDVAHGRLEEDQLERVMQRFVDREIDMLVCTTIVESGLDIPSANTILVNRADRFGLAQMYQLRGRVGRADEQAYAYLFIPHQSILSGDAQKRLKVLMEHSDLGAGFQIAMRDLQIRGGGSILGAEQSGHIAAVGYSMYLKLMENAVAELKGEPVEATLDPEINIDASTFIPESYVPDIDQRLAAYQRLAKMGSVKEINRFKSEMIDRFGPLPTTANHLLLKVMIKIMAKRAGVKRLDQKDSNLFIHFSETHQNRSQNLVSMILARPDQFKLSPDHVLTVRLDPDAGEGVWGQVKNILKQIDQHVNR